MSETNQSINTDVNTNIDADIRMHSINVTLVMFEYVICVRSLQNRNADIFLYTHRS